MSNKKVIMYNNIMKIYLDKKLSSAKALIHFLVSEEMACIKNAPSFSLIESDEFAIEFDSKSIGFRIRDLIANFSKTLVFQKISSLTDIEKVQFSKAFYRISPFQDSREDVPFGSPWLYNPGGYLCGLSPDMQATLFYLAHTLQIGDELKAYDQDSSDDEDCCGCSVGCDYCLMTEPISLKFG